jgi:hypothetical protein
MPSLPDIAVLRQKFPEWNTLESLSPLLEKKGRVEVLGTSKSKNYEFPLKAFVLGNPDPEAPVFGLFGGIHGLERIGSQVCLSFMHSFVELAQWDEVLHFALQKIRVVFFPIINPIGLLEIRRANPRGVDLMRNAPVQDVENPTWMVGGQNISPQLPWYRGDSQMEVESQAVFDFCRKHFFKSKAVITLDCHSGFGLNDRLWYPYAKTAKDFPDIKSMKSWTERFERTQPNHFYTIEPQSKSYTTHGDLWDYTYDQYRSENPQGTYLPLALEMGSWMWVRKNPLQLFSSLGPFNPVKPHRHKRILRRHFSLIDFMIRSLINPDWQQVKK